MTNGIRMAAGGLCDRRRVTQSFHTVPRTKKSRRRDSNPRPPPPPSDKWDKMRLTWLDHHGQLLHSLVTPAHLELL